MVVIKGVEKNKLQFLSIKIRSWFTCISIVCICLLGGCNHDNEKLSHDCIINCAEDCCAKDFCIDMTEFSHELSLKFSAYPYDLKKDPDAYNQAIIDLVANLAEQRQLLCAAKKNGIKVDKEELITAEKSFREGYSDETFEKFMLEGVVKYKFWQQKIEHDLLIRKFIRSSLLSNINISQEEVAEFYAFHKKLNGNKEPDWIKDTDTMILRLKEKKAQADYAVWFDQIAATCPVTINKKLLKLFLIHTPENKG